MKKKIIASISFIVLLCIIALIIILHKPPQYVPSVDPSEVKAALDLLENALNDKSVSYQVFLNKYEENASSSTSYFESQPELLSIKAHPLTSQVHSFMGNDEALSLAWKALVQYEVDVPESGLYQMALDYYMHDFGINQIDLKIEINDTSFYREMNTIGLKQSFKDSTKKFPANRYGDESSPSLMQIKEWKRDYFYDNAWKTAKPILFPFEKGKNIITIENLSKDIYIGSLEIEPPIKHATYEEYLANMEKTKQRSLIKDLENKNYSSNLSYINAIDYVSKNSKEVVLNAFSSVDAIPVSHEKRLINGIFLDYSGSGAVWHFEAPEDGWYSFSLRYESGQDDYPSYVSIGIDGKIPYEEFQNISLKPTHDNFLVDVLSNTEGEPLYVFLDKGTHSLQLTIESEPLMEVYREIQVLLDHINQFALEVTKITGKDIDRTRSWNFTRYIPELEDYLNAYRTIFQDCMAKLQEHSPTGIRSKMISPLYNSFGIIKKMLKYPDEFPLHLDSLNGSDGSLQAIASDLAEELSEVWISLDGIYVSQDIDTLYIKGPSFWDKTVFFFKKTINTFTNDKYKSLVNDENVLNVWVNRSTLEVDMLQELTDTRFTPETGIRVHYSVMPDANKLVLAATANRTPDIAMGLLSHIPFDLSSRGALYDLTQFPDYWDVASVNPPGSMVAFAYNGGMYALPETINVSLLFYRTDIFESLGIEPPDTWEDLSSILPVLQRYGMNFFHQMAGTTGYKWFYQTAPILLQANASFYAPDGLSSELNKPEAVQGLKTLCDLFTTYALPTEVPQFINEFSYGRLPIGVNNLEIYYLIQYGYPQLKGKWSVALNPGTKQEDGSISRWYTSNDKSLIMFKSCEDKNAAWDLIKWWLSAETQTEYAMLSSSSFGGAYIWIPANEEARMNIELPIADRNIILEQAQWLRDVPRTPGQYMLERSLSDMWNAVVFSGETVQTAVDKRILDIQREMRRKMIEFGYLDSDGTVLQTYQVGSIEWIEEQIQKRKGVSSLVSNVKEAP